MCGGGFVGIFEMLPEAFHVELDIGGISLGRVRLGQGPNLRQSGGNLGRVTNVFYGCERDGWVGPLINRGIHKFFGVFVPL